MGRLPRPVPLIALALLIASCAATLVAAAATVVLDTVDRDEQPEAVAELADLLQELVADAPPRARVH